MYVCDIFLVSRSNLDNKIHFEMFSFAGQIDSFNVASQNDGILSIDRINTFVDLKSNFALF